VVASARIGYAGSITEPPVAYPKHVRHYVTVDVFANRAITKNPAQKRAFGPVFVWVFGTNVAMC